MMSIDGTLLEIAEKYGNFSQPFVHMPAGEALALASQHYGISGQMDRLATEKDDTFLIRCGAGRAFILKVEHPRESTGDVIFQTALLDYLRDTRPDLHVPRVIRGNDGAAIMHCTDRAGQVRQVRLLSYLEGLPLEYPAPTPHIRRQIGEQLARLRHALADFAHPGEGRVLIWDVRRLPDLLPVLPLIDDPSHRACAGTAMARFMSLLPAIRGLRTQVLHNDFTCSNLLAVSRQDETITGIIDFGDALRTAVAIDLSTAMAGQLPLEGPADETAFLSASRDVLHGYLKHADLLPEEVTMLGPLMMARVLLRALISTWREMVFPEDCPQMRYYDRITWEQLAWFVERDPDTVSRLFTRDVPFHGS
ncbi:phosphotransferase [Gluconacetobacter entanii]|uniref:Serine kinase n=1 Tax=Gluconacetobacter entanii TaxID=108528 RepID=A0A318PRZ2_9PROT|nr:phosphotransferase [Gluconacetobacter entanii]MCE2577817.1 phosphotransferase [Komagataeibacter sp. FNDCR1]PYD62744.1 serine kinase [Gluconacetobacter entanii]